MDGGSISFVTEECKITEMGGRRYFYLSFDQQLKEYEKRMVCGSDCPYILPMHFISDDGTETAYYDFTGFIKLEEHIRRNAANSMNNREDNQLIRDSLQILNKILECIKGMEGYLLFSERITLHADAIFVNPDNKKMLIAFFPNENPNVTLQKGVLNLIDNMIRDYHDEEVEQNMCKFKDFIVNKNPGLDSMVGVLGTMQREAYYIYSNSNEFRSRTTQSFPGNQARHHDKNGTAYGGEFYKTDDLKKKSAVMSIVIQFIIGAGLTAIYMSGSLKTASFAGAVILAVLIDYCLVHKLNVFNNKISIMKK